MKRLLSFFIGLCAVWLLSLPAHATLAEIASVADGAGQGGYQAAFFALGSGDFASTTTVFNAVRNSSSSVSSVYGLDDPGLSTPLSYSHSFIFFDSFTVISAAAFDPGTFDSFFVSSAAPSGIAKIGVTFSSTTLASGENFAGTIVLDPANNFAYLGTQTSPSIVVKIRMSDLKEIGSLTLPAGLDYLSAAVIDTAHGFAYFASSTTIGAVAKIRLSDFTLAGTLTFNAGEGAVGSAVIDTANGFAYFGTHDKPGKIVRVQLSNLIRSSAITLLNGNNDLTSAVIAPGLHSAYFGTATSPGIVIPINLLAFQAKPALTLGVGDNYLRSAIVDTDNSFAYFGTFTPIGRVVQVDLLAGPPDILVNPTDAVANPGVAVTFAVTANGRNLTFQWQMNGVDIAGATSATYTRVVAATDDGSTFQCVVSNTNGSATSTAANLTIIPIIRAFPNPWRVDRHTGINITFDGLLANSTIKIFNTAAHWVKTLPQATSTTTWDLTNDAGEKVASGYYYYAVTSRSAQQTTQGKIAIIR